jgi:hypothetical protein
MKYDTKSTLKVQYQINEAQDTNKNETYKKKFAVGARFFAHVHSGPGAHPASCTMGTGSFLGVKRPGRDADHPLFLAPRSRMIRAIPILPFWALRDLLQVTFTFTFIIIIIITINNNSMNIHRTVTDQWLPFNTAKLKQNVLFRPTHFNWYSPCLCTHKLITGLFIFQLSLAYFVAKLRTLYGYLQPFLLKWHVSNSTFFRSSSWMCSGIWTKMR